MIKLTSRQHGNKYHIKKKNQHNIGYGYITVPTHLEKNTTDTIKTRYPVITHLFFKIKREITKKHRTIMPIHIILSDLSYIWQTTTRQIKVKTISKKQRKEQHYQFTWEEKKRTKRLKKKLKNFPYQQTKKTKQGS